METSPEQLQDLMSACSQGNFATTGQYSITEVLELLRKKAFDATIFARDLPGMESLTMAVTISKQLNYRKIPLILLDSPNSNLTFCRQEAQAKSKIMANPSPTHPPLPPPRRGTWEGAKGVGLEAD